MFKIIFVTILASAACSGFADEGNSLSDKVPNENNRQRRLLFYDEQGNLVKTYSNPYLNSFDSKGNNVFWNLLNPFFSFLRPSSFSGSTIAYMIPISDAVVQQINNDPVYQNKLLYLTTRDPVMESNPLCGGKRGPIPSPKICSNFLNCWDGWAFEQECPDGLLFSNNGYCDYSHNVDCSNRKLKDIIEPRCRKDFETFRNETNCNEFFVCVNSLPVRFKCPSGLYYNQYLGVCDYNNTVNCNITTMDTIENTSQPTSSTTLSTTKVTTPTVQSTDPVTKPGTVFINSFYDSKTWTSTHVAMSRQEAIRQLKLKSVADVKTAE